MFIERPLASLPSDRVETSIRALVAQDQLLANRRDPNLHTLGFQEVAANWEDAGGPNAFRPIGVFGYCAIADLPIGAALADAARGPAGLAYCIGAADVSGVDVLKTIFIALAHRAQAAGHQRLFVVTHDPRVRAVFGRFGMQFPDELQAGARIVGRFDLAASRDHCLDAGLSEAA